MWARGISVVLVFSMDAQAASCPPFPVGFIRVGDVFHATAEAEALGNSRESLELAIADAGLASRATLQAEKDVPKSPQGYLQGVTQGVCVVGRKAYVTSSLSRASIEQVERLKEMLNKSQQAVPTPSRRHPEGR